MVPLNIYIGVYKELSVRWIKMAEKSLSIKKYINAKVKAGQFLTRPLRELSLQPPILWRHSSFPRLRIRCRLQQPNLEWGEDGWLLWTVARWYSRPRCHCRPSPPRSSSTGSAASWTHPNWSWYDNIDLSLIYKVIGRTFPSGQFRQIHRWEDSSFCFSLSTKNWNENFSVHFDFYNLLRLRLYRAFFGQADWELVTVHSSAQSDGVDDVRRWPDLCSYQELCSSVDCQVESILIKIFLIRQSNFR